MHINKEKVMALLAVLLFGAGIAQVWIKPSEPAVLQKDKADRKKTRRPSRRPSSEPEPIEKSEILTLSELDHYLVEDGRNLFEGSEDYQALEQIHLDRVPLPLFPRVLPRPYLIPFVEAASGTVTLGDDKGAVQEDDWIKFKDGTIKYGRIDLETKNSVSIYIPSENRLREFSRSGIAEVFRSESPLVIYRKMQKTIDHGHVDDLVKLAQWAYVNRLRNEARSNLTLAIKVNGADPQPYLLLGEMEVREGKPERALAILAKGLERAADLKELAAQAAALYAQLGKVEEGLAFLEPLMKSHQSAIAKHLGILQYLQGDYAAAEKIFRNIATQATHDMTLANGYALCLFALGKRQQAVEVMDAFQPKKIPSVQFLNNHGVLLFAQERQSEAVKIMQSAINRDPSFVALHYNLGCFAMTQGAYAQARGHFRSVSGREKDLRSRAGIAAVDLAQGKEKEAADGFEQVIADGMNEPWIQYLLGLARYELEDQAGARKAFLAAGDRYMPALAGLSLLATSAKDPQIRKHLQDALTAAPADNDIRLRLAILSMVDDKALAEALFKEVLPHDPMNLYARNGLAVLKYEAGKRNEAIRAFKAIAEWETSWKKAGAFLLLMDTVGSQPLGFEPMFTPLTPSRKNFSKLLEDWQNQEPISVTKLSDYCTLANDLLIEGQTDDARAIYEEALKRNKAFSAAHLGMGYLAVREGNLAVAKDFFIQAKNADAKSANARNEMGVCYFLEGDYRKAKNEFLRVLRHDVTHPRVYTNLALTFWKLDNIDEGIEELKARVEVEIDNPDPLLGLARLYLIQKEMDKALALLLEAKELAPSQARIRLHLADAYLAAGNIEEAEFELQAAMGSDPRSWEGKARYAVLAGAQGRYADALGMIDEAAQAGGAGVELYYRKALYALRLGDLEKAASAFQTLQEMNSDDPIGEQGIASLALMKEAGFDFARLSEKLREFQPVEDWAAGALERITGSRGKRFWRDDFDRDDGTSLMRNWREFEGFGIEIALADGQVLMAGTQAREDWGETLFSRITTRKQLVEFSIEVDTTTTGQICTGIVLVGSKQALYFGRTPDGQLGYSTSGLHDDWTVVGEWPVSGKAKLVFRLKDAQRGTYDLVADGALAASNIGMGLFKADSELSWGGFSMATQGTSCEVRFDHAYLEEYQ